jgi:ribonuclease HII
VVTKTVKRRAGAGAGASLFEFDRSLGVRFVAGADEAGRGCLAGPLMVAAVLFDEERLTALQRKALAALNDSKQTSAQVRAKLYPVILQVAARVCVISRSAATIDREGLHRTNLDALRTALTTVACDGCVCLSDGFSVAPSFRALVKGDATSAAVAAASVIAKETRDRYMRRADRLYPGYGLAEHVGYATTAHRDAIARLGVTPLHRLSFQSTAYQQLRLV